MMIAVVPASIVAAPKVAPILFSLSGSLVKVPGSFPARNIPTRKSTCARVKFPVIWPLTEIRVLMVAADNNLWSSTIPSKLLVLLPVKVPNLRDPALFIVNDTHGEAVWVSISERTLARSSPVVRSVSSGVTINTSILVTPAFFTCSENTASDSTNSNATWIAVSVGVLGCVSPSTKMRFSSSPSV